MEKQKAFLDTPECTKFFVQRKETELTLLSVGYNDFHHVRPSKIFRVQPFYTLHFVLAGKGCLHFNGERREICAGEIFALPPSPPFCYYPDEREPWEYVFFEFDGELAKEYLESVGFTNDCPARLCSNPQKVLPALAEFFERHKNGIPVSYFEGCSLFFNLLHAAAGTDSKLLSLENGDVVEQAKNLIETHCFDAELSVEQIASSLHFSHSRLCRLFKQKTGVTMIAYLNDRRMKYAEELLRTTNLKATEIAYAAGFREYTYFLMKFKRRHQKTTSQYRALAAKNPST